SRPHTASTARYTLSLHDALPISLDRGQQPLLAHGLKQIVHGFPLERLDRVLIVGRHENHMAGMRQPPADIEPGQARHSDVEEGRSEEHTSELQSRENLVCRLLLE